MKLLISHLTRHRYEIPVSFSEHSLYLRPLESHLRQVYSCTVSTIPESRQRYVRDVDGNTVLKCNFGLTESKVLEFKTEIAVTITEDNPYDFLLEPYAVSYPFSYREPDATALQPYLSSQVSSDASSVMDWFYSAVKSPLTHPDSIEFLTDLNQAIRRDISYIRRDEKGIQTPNETLRLRTGTCRDMAVLFIATVRQNGLAARFVSGYLFDPKVVDGKEGAGEYLYNRAVGSMHAWAEVYLPGAGWKGFDPTNGILANGFFIPSGSTHHPPSVDPIQGVYYSKIATESELEVELLIEEKL